MGVKLILLGDADGQRKPIFDKWAQAMKIKDIRTSRFIHELCGGVRVKLTTYRRGIDHELFRFYTGLYPIADEMAGSNLYSLTVRNASRMYPTKDECDCYFVVKHEHRILINRFVNFKMATQHSKKRYIPAPEDESTKVYMKPQAMIVWPGMELICYNRKVSKGSPITGAVYIVQDWDEKSKTIVVKLHPDYIFKQIEELTHAESDDEDGEEDEESEEGVEEVAETDGDLVYKLSFAKASQILRPQFALCYASIQGRTFRDKHIGLLNYTQNRTLGMRDIITASSRPTHGDFLHFISREHEGTLLAAAACINDTDLMLAAQPSAQ